MGQKKSPLGQPGQIKGKAGASWLQAGCYLAGVHVVGQLEAPLSAAVAGVGPRGVDAGLLTASLCTLVHICRPQGNVPTSLRVTHTLPLCLHTRYAHHEGEFQAM